MNKTLSAERGIVCIIQPTKLLGYGYYKLGCIHGSDIAALINSEPKNTRFIYIAECSYPYLLLEKLKERFADVFKAVKELDISDDSKHYIPAQDKPSYTNVTKDKKLRKSSEYKLYETQPTTNLDISEKIYGISPSVDLYKADIIAIKKEFISVELEHQAAFLKNNDQADIITIDSLYNELFNLEKVRDTFRNYKEDIAYGGDKILFKFLNDGYSHIPFKVLFINNDKKLVIHEVPFNYRDAHLFDMLKNGYIKPNITYDLNVFMSHTIYKDKFIKYDLPFLDKDNVLKPSFCIKNPITQTDIVVGGNYTKELKPEILNGKLYLIYKYLICNVVCNGVYGYATHNYELFDPILWSSKKMISLLIRLFPANKFWKEYPYDILIDQEFLKLFIPNRIDTNEDVCFIFSRSVTKHKYERSEIFRETNIKMLQLGDDRLVKAKHTPTELNIAPRINELIAALNEFYMYVNGKIWINYDANIKKLISDLTDLPVVKDKVKKCSIAYYNADGDIVRDGEIITMEKFIADRTANNTLQLAT